MDNLKNDQINKKITDCEKIDYSLKFLQLKTRMTSCIIIGKGGFGVVYEILIKNIKYAMKLMKYEDSPIFSINKEELNQTADTTENSSILIDNESKIFSDKDENSEVYNAKIRKMQDHECAYLMTLNNKHVVKGVFEFKSKYHKMIIMDFCENSDLDTLIKLFYNKKIFKNISFDSKIYPELERNKFLTYPKEIFLKFFLIQIINGLKYLNDSNLVHLDLNPKNVLLNKDFVCKISDLFTARLKNQFQDLTKISTRNYMSPEYRLNHKAINYDNITKIDIFSLGCILFKFAFNIDFLKSEDIKVYNEERFYLFNFNHKFKFLEENFKNLSGQFIEFLKGLLEVDINKRFNLNKVLNHEWIKSLKNLKFYQELFYNDNIKFLLELQKIGFSDYFFNRINENIYENYEKEFEIIDEVL